MWKETAYTGDDKTTLGGRRREKDFGLFLTTVIGRPAKEARRSAKNSLFLCSVASDFFTRLAAG
ncbi:hypothetical protein PspLS_05639 [Pyricularia sp. CBS 133598]|nr:hypothetical protein PspLS_05639 [Pyricularia sp. CBS 133598]